ncbi:MAG: AbiH family protein [Bacteroidales bacterium]|jgi:hypothetical protein|nr:AbiH family protein [Bacteroidales bacterium]
MNRIILIGNGFDLAHELPTRYNDFLNNLWINILQNPKNYSYLVELPGISASLLNGKKESFLKIVSEKSKELIIKINAPNIFSELKKEYSPHITFNNNFFKTICYKSYLKNWVDIEKEYYESLKNWVDIEKEYYESLYFTSKEEVEKKKIKQKLNEKFDEVKNLNKEFEEIRDSLKKYLDEIPSNENRLDINLFSKIYIKDIPSDRKKNLEEDIYNYYVFLNLDPKRLKLNEEAIHFNESLQKNNKQTKKDLIGLHLTNQLKNKNDDYIDKYLMPFPENILFLNFNYTSTEQLIPHSEIPFDVNTENVENIHIHGELNNTDNPIIFGYGDELDEKYKEIENLDNNDFLENIKSIKYSETPNYSKLMEYIYSDSYEVFVLGHSCGLSDRTLLNTLFEHENCVSIKPFYYEYIDEETGESNDNYSDIVRNISRCFNSKPLMRDRVVNKQYCEPIVKIEKK